MANDAIILTLDSLEFTWSAARTMNAYLVGVATDNLGTVLVTETPSTTQVRHRPNNGRPFRWPLAFDGFSFYQRTGGLPDVVTFSLLIVRDRRRVRKAGSMLEGLSADQEFQGLLSTISKGAGGGGAAAVAALGSIVSLIGKQLTSVEDKLLDTIDGSLHFDPVRRSQEIIESEVTSAIARAHFDFHLFDANVDEDSAAGIRGSLDDLGSRGLLIGTTPGQSG